MMVREGKHLSLSKYFWTYSNWMLLSVVHFKTLAPPLLEFKYKNKGI